jgi:hypothetical protein
MLMKNMLEYTVSSQLGNVTEEYMQITLAAKAEGVCRISLCIPDNQTIIEMGSGKVGCW